MKLRRFLMLCITCFIVVFATAQELVYNGGFEEHFCLPTKISDILCCKGWNEINWIPDGQPPYGTPDYYVDSASYNLSSIASTDCEIVTHSGAATMRIGTYRKKEKDYREYLATHLLEPLVPGATYSLSFWVNNGTNFPERSNMGYACAGLGIAFTSQRITAVPHEVINRKPQLQIAQEIWVNEWTQYRFDFQADSAYEYMTIGFFLNDAKISCNDQLAHQTTVPESRASYYFFDEISLIQKEGAFGDTVICDGETAVLNAFYRNGRYAWIDRSRPDSVFSRASQVTVSPAVTTTYIVYSDQNWSALTVQVVKDTMDFLPADTTICEGDVLELTVPAGFRDYRWHDGSKWPQHHLSEAGDYWLEVYDHHCVLTDSIALDLVFCGCAPFVPNAFTPNNDSHNEVFQPVFDCPLDRYQLVVFNRWGETVFESSSAEKGWNGMLSGRKAAVGAYVYVLQYKLFDGSEHQLRGLLNLLR
jgi:gliding motility-associated-like protein